jgi:hypothetical protein
MRRGAVSLVLAALVFGGCSSGSKDAEPAQSRTDTRSTKTTSDESAVLDQAVREAVRLNARLSDYVLRHNTVPRWARNSTRGPALAALRESAAERRRQRIRVRGTGGDFDVLAVQLDPSYLRATAVVRERGRIRPYRNGRRLGRTVKVDEKVRIELRRLGGAERFVVWKVAPTK